jgi:hypothetical protein
MYHFTTTKGTLGYGDGRQVLAGETLTVEGKPVLCEHGLHACEHIYDALKYASGPRLWDVELGGIVMHDIDKSVGSERTAIRDYGDVLPLIVRFAKWCAKRAKKHTARAAAYAARAAAYAAHADAHAADAAAYAAYAAAHAAYAAAHAAYAAAHAADAAAYAAHADAHAAHAADAADAAAHAADAAERQRQDKWWHGALRREAMTDVRSND